MGMGGADLGFRVSQGGLLGATTALRRHASLNFRLAHREKRRAPARSTALSSGEPAMPAAGVDGRRGRSREALGRARAREPRLGDTTIDRKPLDSSGEPDKPLAKRRRRSQGSNGSASTASLVGATSAATKRRWLAVHDNGGTSRAVREDGGAEGTAGRTKRSGGFDWFTRIPR